jgi:ABC-2 type transport system ATP-binding protein
MLEAVHLTKRYNGVAALEDLTLRIMRIMPGEVFCLLGANGAGKTTTINLFLNFVQPTGGSATINGIDVTERPLETKKYLAYVPETVMLYKNLTGLENLEYFSALAGRAEYTDPKAANEFSALLSRLSQDGVAVLMATHDLFRAKESGTRVGIMKHGRLVRTLETTEVGHADLERIYLEHMHE